MDTDDEMEDPERWTMEEKEKLLHFVTKIFLLNFPSYMAYKHMYHSSLEVSKKILDSQIFKIKHVRCLSKFDHVHLCLSCIWSIILYGLITTSISQSEIMNYNCGINHLIMLNLYGESCRDICIVFIAWKVNNAGCKESVVFLLLKVSSYVKCG